ncbi:hypothetical protein LCGC14_2839510 [marine sediment metagenome]|uniref:Uncharacterized protein n=1 Tax=marine sediment metagenome TaxID=412755 RepID=A0A0F9AK06_9ZZZZ
MAYSLSDTPITSLPVEPVKKSKRSKRFNKIKQSLGQSRSSRKKIRSSLGKTSSKRKDFVNTILSARAQKRGRRDGR